MITPNPTNPTVAPHSMRGSAVLSAVAHYAPRQRGPVSPAFAGAGKHGATEGRLAGELHRAAKPVHREVAMLTATGLIERRAADEVAVGWDRAMTQLDLAA